MGDVQASLIAIECTAALDPVRTETWNLGPGRGKLKFDLNQDGHVDVLDAFQLARQIKAGGPLDLKYDVNGDGVVDQRDVAAIASTAVSLQHRSVQ